MNEPLQALQDQFILLTNQMPVVLAQCGGDTTCHNNFMTSYVQSRKNYWKGIHTIFHDDDPEVQQLVSAMNAEQLTLKATIEHMGEIAKVIDAVTKAVSVGSDLLAAAAGV